ncbi:hypothetical protein C1H46_036341 [Malus baccata]|uniref:Uncharacterized protein n=1 Tax=Malus baccata TaxID=106549 RepID=A0A540KV62_MALBA|nr:hypothetical protein C1H46_036341 [Malus baccata]
MSDKCEGEICKVCCVPCKVYHHVSLFEEGESTRSDLGFDDGVSSDDGDIQKLEDEGDSDEDEYFQGMTEDE